MMSLVFFVWLMPMDSTHVMISTITKLRQIEIRGDSRRGAVRGGQFDRQMQAEAFQQLVEIARPAGGHGRRLQRVFQNQIPTDHEGDQLAERQIRVRIGGAGNRCHRGELRIAQARKTAADGGEQEGHAQCRSRGERALAGEHEDAGADDGADAQHGQVEGFQCSLQRSRFGDKLVHRLLAK